MGWLLMNDREFSGGSTVVAFIGLYMLARYLNLHVNFSGSFNNSFTLGMYYLILVLGLTSLEILLPLTGLADRVSNLLINMSMSYLSPNVILASVLFFLCFQQIHFSSRIVNWIAISAFGSILLHSYLYDLYFEPMIRLFYANNTLSVFLAKTFCLMLSFLLVGVLLDKIRILLWNIIYKYIANMFTNHNRLW